MKAYQTGRGFRCIDHPVYAPLPDEPKHSRLVQESSAALYDLYDDAVDRPGTSALWIGEHHHLNRNEVRELIAHLQSWLDTGSLEVPR